MHGEREELGRNPCVESNAAVHLEARLARRDVLRGGLGAAALAALGEGAGPRRAAAAPLFAFKGVPVSRPTG